MAGDDSKRGLSVVDFPEDTDGMAGAVEALRRNLPLMKEYHAMCAELYRTKYLALIEAGFTESQALELCRVMR